MAGLRDLFDQTKGMAKLGFEIAKSKASIAAIDIKDKIIDPAITYGKALASDLRTGGTATQELIRNPRPPRSTFDGNYSKGEPGFETLDEMKARRATQGARGAPAQPTRPVDTPGIRANPARAAAGGAGGVPPTQGGVQLASDAERAAARGPGGLRGVASKVGKYAKGLGAAGAGLAVYDAAEKAQAGEIPEQRALGTDPVTAGGIEALDSSTLGAGRPFVHAVKGGLDAMIDPRPAGQPAGVRASLGNFVDKVTGGWQQGRQLNARGAEATPADARRGAAPTRVNDVSVANGPPAELAAGAPRPGTVPTDEGDQTADQLIGGTAVPASGTGAFQRTTPGNRGPATLVDSRPSLRDAEATPTQQDPNSPFQRLTPGGRGPQANLAGGFAALAAKRINENVQGARIDRVTKAAVARQAGAAVRGKGVDAFVANEVKRDTTLSKDKDERAQQIDERTADLSQRFSRAAASLGKDKSDLTPVELSQIKIGNDFRKSLENRGTIEFFRDLFGENRFDHENPLSYLPTDFQPSALGASISLGGNRIQVSKATRNGETHWFAPNDPTKADLTAFVELARKSKKGSK